ncbi:MAG: FtsX-like permease family protein, partial [Streptococcaceae bacterium]|nr:FtsX-like permease family protein [Streptococcaceae bacterium]
CATDIKQAKKTHPYWYVDGRFPRVKGEVLVGQELAERFRFKLGESYSLIGETSELENRTAKVTIAGILQTGGKEEAMMYGDISCLNQLFTNQQFQYDVIEASVAKNESELIRLGKEIERLSHQQIRFEVAKQLTISEGVVSKKLTALIFFVTIIVLIITLICVGTTMMSVVTERRKEVGLKKALGATDASIVVEFLGEGSILGIIGGSFGIILGYFFAKIVGLQVFGRLVTFPLWLFPLTIVIALLITLLACFIPVKSALKVDSAIVLKGE